MKRTIILFTAMMLALAGNAVAQCNDGNYNCYLVINGTDSYGDGWSGCSITFTQNNTTIGTFTLSGWTMANFVDTLRICTDNGPVSCTWTRGSMPNECSFDISDSAGTMLYSCGNGYYLYDGVVFAVLNPCPSCPYPTGVMSQTVTATTASVGWDAGSNAVEWLYMLTTTPDPVGEWESTSVPNVTFEDLLQDHSYWCHVRAYCDDDDTSETVTLFLHTDCGEVADLPTSEGFEEELPYFSYCWNIIEQAVYDPYSLGGEPYPRVVRSAGYPYGVNSPSAVSLMSAGGNVSFRSPLIPLTPNEIEVKFWAHGEGTLLVGYVTSAVAGGNDFHLVDSITLTTDYAQYTVLFDTVALNDYVYVAFRKMASTSLQPIIMDDIVVRRYTPCSEPENLRVIEDMGDALAIGWTDSVGYSWQLVWGPEGFDPDEVTDPINTNVTHAIVPNLDDTTIYQFYVRSVCNMGQGYWIGPLSAMTHLYTMNDSMATVTTCNLNIVDDGGLTGDYSPNTDYTLVLLPASEDSTLRLTGWVKLGTNIYYPSLLEVYEGTDTNGRLLASYTTTPDMQVDLLSETGPLTLRFRPCHTRWYVSDGFLLKAQCVNPIECPTPYGLTVTEVAGDSVRVQWSYDTTLYPDEFVITAFDTLHGLSYDFYPAYDQREMTLTGLDERTVYLISLQASCSGTISSGDTIWCTTDCINGGYLSVGVGTASSRQLPGYLYTTYGVGQQIYTDSEVEGITEITGLQLYVDSLGNNAYSTSYRFDIYIDTTSQAFYTDTQLVRQDSAHLVFSGQVPLVPGLNTILFDNAWLYPGVGNVVLTFNTLNGSLHENVFLKASSLTHQRSICASAPYSPIDPTSAVGIASLPGYSKHLLDIRTDVTFITSCNSHDCQAPTIISAVPADTTVMLAWEGGSGANGWNISYRQVDSVEWVMAATGIHDTFYMVSGLEAGTDYFLRVSSICNAGAASAVTVATTLCYPKAIPFTESFDNGFTASAIVPTLMQHCWYRGSDNEAYVGAWIAGGQGYASNKCLALDGYHSYLVLPLMAQNVSLLAIDFYAYMGMTIYGNQTFEIGVATDPEDVSTFSVVKTYTLSDADVWRRVHAGFDTWNGPDGHIFIRMHTTSYASVRIDNIVVDLLPDCLTPASMHIDTVTPSSITVTINETHNTGHYIVYYGTTPDLSDADSMIANSATATISGLTDGTEYYLWARTLCSATEMSDVLEGPVARTLCQPVAVTGLSPWFEDFEFGDLDCMWQSPDAIVPWQAMQGNVAMHAYSGYRMAKAGFSTNLILPTYNFSGLDSLAELDFYSFSNGGSLTIRYRLGTTGAWTTVTTVTGDNGVWQTHYVTLPASQGAALYQVALIADGEIYLDDLTVRAASSCPVPTGITVRNVTERTATVAWTGSAPAYRVQYRRAGGWSWNARTATGIDTLVVSPLDMGSDYEVRVVALCDGFEESAPSNTVAFTTALCADRQENLSYTSAQVATTTELFASTAHANSYTEILVDASALADMTTIDALSFSPAATLGGSSLDDCRIYLGVTYDNTMTAFHYNNDFTLVYSGSLNFADTGWRQVVFDTPYEWDGSSNVVVGILYHRSADGAPTASYNAHMDTVNKVYTGFSDLPTYLDPAEAHLLLAAARQASNAVPDLMLMGCTPVCYAPVVSSIAATSYSVSVGWYNEGAAVQMQIKEADANDWSTLVNVVDANSYTFDLLAPSTLYNVRLRHDCQSSATGYSEWVNLTVTTEEPCPVPTNLHVASINGSTVAFAWDGDDGVTAWQLRIWNNSGTNMTIVSQSPALTVEGLEPGIYNAAVRALCGDDASNASEECLDISFDNICYPVSELTATVVDGDVMLTWEAGMRNQRWMVSYGYQGFSPNQQLGFLMADTPSATVTGLAGGHTYGFLVRAYCADTWVSDWNDAEATATLEGIDGPSSAFGTAFSIHPNPATASVTLTLADFTGQAVVTLLDLTGRTLSAFDMQQPTLSIDVSQLAAGTYFLRVVTPDGSSVRKLLVQRH